MTLLINPFCDCSRSNIHRYVAASTKKQLYTVDKFYSICAVRSSSYHRNTYFNINRNPSLPQVGMEASPSTEHLHIEPGCSTDLLYTGHCILKANVSRNFEAYVRIIPGRSMQVGPGLPYTAVLKNMWTNFLFCVRNLQEKIRVPFTPSCADEIFLNSKFPLG